MLDGVWLSVGSRRATRRAALVVYGVRSDGRRELVAFRQARGESREEWAASLWVSTGGDGPGPGSSC